MNKKIFISLTIFISLIIGILVETDVINKHLYPTKYKNHVEKYSKKYDIDKYLVYSIIKAESKFDKDALSHRNAKGLMQISDITKKWAEKELKLDNINLYDPEVNIMVGCWYLKKLYREFGNTQLVIAAYNGGSGNLNKWLKKHNLDKDDNKLPTIPFKETENYIEKVGRYYAKYQKIYIKEGRN